MSGTPQHQVPTPTVKFKGRTRADSKRRALNYWYQNRDTLRLDLRTFFDQCRLQPDDSTIVFYATQ